MLKYKDLIEVLKNAGYPKFRAEQVFQAVYKKGGNDYENISTLPGELKEFLKENVPVYSFGVGNRMVSKIDGTQKVLFELCDGKKVEAVLMRYSDKTGKRNTVCVSSQVGCALKCAFCATGKLGFSRDLTAEEIADQVLYFDHILKAEEERVTNVVYMGMGEPFLNYDKVMKSVRILNDEKCLNIAARGITVSTSGVIEGIEKFSEENLQVNLAVSLHVPTQDGRAEIMPIARANSLDKLMESLDDYVFRTNRRVSYEYVLLKGVNDGVEDARDLAELLQGRLCHVNLIQYNETGLPFKKSGKSEGEKFLEILEGSGVPVSLRISRGQDIFGACGQLAGKENAG
ncbi:23S rRNA (adenine(2503)-C(2))-methyltransferase RlmN [Candidatus Peregrinibacteria bacterium]|jgi:23S rRNA (adenine2503-C2)-methyltransferase|nr:23S rRNA (adenine(2503)-C(2))-methyltransferase RlmN [Candidatus Peregrinibacteria bacterium]